MLTVHYRPPSEGWGKVIVSVCSHFGGGGGLFGSHMLTVHYHLPSKGWGKVIVSVCSHFRGGVPDPALDEGGSQVSDFRGGVPGLRFLGGGVPGLRFFGGGVPGLRFRGGGPSLSKRKNFWHQIWLDTCSDWKKNLFVEGPLPPSKGKIFWHQIWLDTCSDWKKKIFVKGPSPTPPPGIARNCYGHAAGGMPLAFT